MGRTIKCKPFAYPAAPHVRKHGPDGYSKYDSYRPWLRDEFSFQCVYCLSREQWGTIGGIWDIDHFVPQNRDETLSFAYRNLLYACRTCNVIKSNKIMPDPCLVAYGACLAVHPDGAVTPLNDNGKLIIEILRLNSEERTKFRFLILATLRSLEKHDRATFVLWMSYPKSLPDLSNLRPPSNTKPSGLVNSFYARRSRGELPEIY